MQREGVFRHFADKQALITAFVESNHGCIPPGESLLFVSSGLPKQGVLSNCTLKKHKMESFTST
jgi:hypothetical protein